MDEPCSALDPIATFKIETLINDLKRRSLCHHSHAQRAAGCPGKQFPGVYVYGRDDQCGKTTEIFEHPKEELTENYIAGRFG